ERSVRRRGSDGPMKYALLLALAFALVLARASVPGARAQSLDQRLADVADSTVADSLAAASDEFGPMPGVTGPYGPPTENAISAEKPKVSPKVETTVKSSVASIEVRGLLEGNLAAFAGRQGHTR